MGDSVKQLRIPLCTNGDEEIDIGSVIIGIIWESATVLVLHAAELDE
jgi:hypothetical protein